MLLVGDKVKQVKAIPGFNFVGQVFNVGAIKIEGEEVTIMIELPYVGVGLMTKSEFEQYFEKVVEPTWSDWQDYCCDLEYRLKGELIEARVKGTKDSVFSKPCKEDKFDLDIGMGVCIEKLKIKEIEDFVEDITRKTEAIINKAQEDIHTIREIIRTRF